MAAKNIDKTKFPKYEISGAIFLEKVGTNVGFLNHCGLINKIWPVTKFNFDP